MERGRAEVERGGLFASIFPSRYGREGFTLQSLTLNFNERVFPVFIDL